jgi:predicted DNA-binding transcriptional regulator YafY
MPHDRASEWTVILRCLALIRRLLQADATGAELLDIIRQHDAEPERLTPGQLQDRLEKDLKRLRTNLGYDVQYVHSERVYRLDAVEGGLVDLSDDALRGLAFLQKTFDQSDVVHSEEVRVLVAQVLRLLPEERARQAARMRGLLEVNLQARDTQPLDEPLLEDLMLACGTHREIEFAYLSPSYADGQPRRHHVQPLRVYLEPARRHYLLEARKLASAGIAMAQPAVHEYRVERMRDLVLLPAHFRPVDARAQPKELVYRLKPEIARAGDVAEIVTGSVIQYLPDGSAEVHAVSHSLFRDVRALLFYGANCEVIGGEDARREMRALVQALAQTYSVLS